MALGFFLGLKNDLARIITPDNKLVEIPAKRIPAGMRPGQDFNYKSTKSGNIYSINAPADKSTRKASNSAKDRQQYVVKRLIAKGYSPAQAAGAVGRMMVESYPHLDTGAVGDKEIPGASIGITQVNRERQAALKAFATGKNPGGKYANDPRVIAALKASQGGRDIRDLDTQIDFFDWELRNFEPMAWQAMKVAKTPEQAAEAMMHFERPRGYKPGNPTRGMHWSRTVSNAKNVMAAFDPSYVPSVDTAGIAAKTAVAMKGLGAGISEDDPGFSMVDAGDPELLGEVPEAEAEEEDTFGGAVSTAADAYGAETGTVDTSDNMQAILQMIQQGVQANQGALPGLPTFRDLFGEG